MFSSENQNGKLKLYNTVLFVLEKEKLDDDVLREKDKEFVWLVGLKKNWVM